MLAHSVTPFQMGGWVHTIRDVFTASPGQSLFRDRGRAQHERAAGAFTLPPARVFLAIAAACASNATNSPTAS